MDNLIKVIDLEGNEVEVEVLDIFSVTGYEDKEYIMYTMNKKLDDNNVEVLISVLEKVGDQYNLETITDEAEWEEVQKAIDEMGEVAWI